MPKDRKVVEAGLLKKGFRQREGDHHFFVYWSLRGKKSVAFTKTSHSHREIGDPLLGRMAKQCKLTKANFLGLVDCPLSREQYEDLLTKQGAV